MRRKMKLKFSGFKNINFIISLVALVCIVFLLAGNMALAYFAPSAKMYLDMTNENFYTLSDAMKRETKFIEELSGEKKLEIIFCTDPDYLTASETTRLPYFMALQLQKRYSDNLEVKTVNCRLNPTALAQYKSTSLSEIDERDIIVSYGDRYRIFDMEMFWTTEQSGQRFSFDGEYFMVMLMRSVTAIELPKAYFIIDHGESYYDVNDPESEMSLKTASLAEMLRNCGVEIKTLKISEAEKIPDDCVLLIINNPREDFKTDPDRYGELAYISDTEKIDRYLVKNQGALIVAKDFRTELPVLEDFLFDWGFEFGDTLVKDDESSVSGTNGETIIAEYNKDPDSYAYTIYGEYADVSSAPSTVFKNTGYIKCSFKESFATNENGAMNTTRLYRSFLSTSASAKTYAKNPHTGEYTDPSSDASKYDMAAISFRDYLDTEKNEHLLSFILCSNSADFLSNEVLGNPSYANFDIFSAVTKDISRIDVFGSMDLGGGSQNSSSFLGKQFRYPTLSENDVKVYSADAREVIEYNYGITQTFIVSFAVIVFAIPVIVAAAGVAAHIRRKFL